MTHSRSYSASEYPQDLATLMKIGGIESLARLIFLIHSDLSAVGFVSILFHGCFSAPLCGSLITSLLMSSTGDSEHVCHLEPETAIVISHSRIRQRVVQYWSGRADL